LNDFNGECYIPEKHSLTNEAMQLLTDSAGNVNLGCGHILQVTGYNINGKSHGLVMK
jgi:hypothetical protein